MISFQVTHTESTQTKVVKLTELTAYPVGTNIIVLEGLDMRSTPLPWDFLGVKIDTGFSS